LTFDELEEVREIPLKIVTPSVQTEYGGNLSCYAVQSGERLSATSIYALHKKETDARKLLIVRNEPPPAPNYEVIEENVSGACPTFSCYRVAPNVENRAYTYRMRVLDAETSEVAQDWSLTLQPVLWTTNGIAQPGDLYIGGNFIVEIEAIDGAGRGSGRSRVPVHMQLTRWGCDIRGIVAPPLKVVSLVIAFIWVLRRGLRLQRGY
jgi:hypothetical protein